MEREEDAETESDVNEAACCISLADTVVDDDRGHMNHREIPKPHKNEIETFGFFSQIRVTPWGR